MRRFLSLRYVMTSNVPFERKEDGFSISRYCDHYGLFTKYKETERRVKFKGNGKRCGEETEKV